MEGLGELRKLCRATAGVKDDNLVVQLQHWRRVHEGIGALWEALQKKNDHGMRKQRRRRCKGDGYQHEDEESLYDNEGQGPLHKLALAGMEKSLDYLLHELHVYATADSNNKEKEEEEGMTKHRQFLQLVNERDKSWKTPLMLAAAGGYVNTTRILLDYGANPNERKPNGWTALLYGCKSGSEEVVRELVNLGASTDVRNKEKATPLYIAAREGSNEVVTFLVDHCNADPAAERTTNGRAPLHTAISNTDPYVFDTLIQKTRCLALPSIKDNSAHTLHHEAADVGSISCCSVLEKFSFRFWTAGTNIAGQFPLQLAVLRMHEDFVAHVLQLLKEQNHSQSGVQVQLDQAVYDACTKGCSSILTMLLENGANPNYCGKRRSALHAASLGGTRDHIQCVETLLQHGADPTFQDIDGLAALESTQSLIHEYVSQTGTVRATTANSQEHRFACLHKTVEVLERHMTRKERRDKPINQYNRD